MTIRKLWPSAVKNLTEELLARVGEPMRLVETDEEIVSLAEEILVIAQTDPDLGDLIRVSGDDSSRRAQLNVLVDAITLHRCRPEV